MSAPATPVRVIYAKLTSTGDYDVVAKTSNIELNAARSLAEKLLLGNVPHDTIISEELAYLRPPEGGHIFIRYTTYNWKDENRGGAFMTDILWLNDADAARGRGNAFALVPHSDDVYDVLTTIPDVVVPVRSPDADFARLGALHAEAQPSFTLLPFALRGQPVLSIDRHDQRGAIELLTLLLPPLLRRAITFQTRAFRVPAHPPRITMSDAMHANLQGGPWAHVLPDPSLDVPMSLAQKLADAAARPASLRLAHDMYDAIGTTSDDLRAEATRVLDLVTFADSLEAGDLSNAFRLASAGTAAESAVKLAAVHARSTPADMRAAVLSSIDQGAPGSALALRLLATIATTDDAAAATLDTEIARRVIASGTMPSADLASHLIGRLAAADDANALILLLGLDVRGASALVPAQLPETRSAVFVRAVAAASKGRRDLASVTALISAAAAIAPHVSEPAALTRLAVLCRESAEAALEKVTLTQKDVRDLRSLQDAGDALLAKAPTLRDPLPRILSDGQFVGIAASETDSVITDIAARFQPEMLGAVAVALITRSAEGPANAAQQRRLDVARRILTKLHATVRSQAQRVMEELSVGADAVLALPGGDELLPLLGRNAEQTSSTRDLLQAVRELGDSDAAIAKLAVAVLAARAAHMQLARSNPAFAPLKTAVVEALTRRRAGSGADTGAVVEITLDLLATVTDAEAFAELEATVASGGNVTVRLRRLDRAVALCRAAEDETAYEQLALAIESPGTPISDASRQRLRDALGTGGLQRRLIQMITGVVERNA